MSDMNGADLSAGDPVGWYGGNGRAEMVAATVLREVSPSRYLIQIDRPATDAVSNINVVELLEQNMVEHGFERDDALQAAAGFRQVDPQEPFEVDGTELELRQGT
jgi:hypothetical protein